MIATPAIIFAAGSGTACGAAELAVDLGISSLFMPRTKDSLDAGDRPSLS
jgi:hypothetical protein